MDEFFPFAKLTSVYANLANKILTCLDSVGIMERMLPQLTAIILARSAKTILMRPRLGIFLVFVKSFANLVESKLVIFHSIIIISVFDNFMILIA